MGVRIGAIPRKGILTFNSPQPLVVRCPHRRARAHPMRAGARSQRRLGPMGAGRAIRHVVRKAPHISEPAGRPGSRQNPERVDAATRTGNPDLNTHSQTHRQQPHPTRRRLPLKHSIRTTPLSAD
ncbi:hypothetical protein HPB52_003613 [Rhipicephalus sanguineus]|uniref:Uncharacterized protein n=1 Tax=Rhipicephalus sanguineus TaxID=34632 RepID=A0A9D4PVB0_RHISA|nr:hypothetical protein HPB52_003613 [Rhipicephalus sanguineus]